MELGKATFIVSGSQLADSGQFRSVELIGQPRVAQSFGKSLSVRQHPLQETSERSALGPGVRKS
jgi:hypothetical protein